MSIRILRLMNQDFTDKEFKIAIDSLDTKVSKWTKLFNFTSFALTLFGLGILFYTLNYLLRFDPDEIHSFIHSIEHENQKKNKYSLPPLALSLLDNHPQRIRWKWKGNVWYFVNQNGKEVPFDKEYFLIERKKLDRLYEDHGVQWNGNEWVTIAKPAKYKAE